MGAGLGVAFIGVHREIPEHGRQMGVRVATHRNLPPAQAVADQILDCCDFQVVFDGEGLQIRHAGHCPVVAHDLADHGRGLEARKADQIHAAFGLSGAGKHAPGLGLERKNMARGDQILGPHFVGHGRLDSGCAVSGGDAGG